MVSLMPSSTGLSLPVPPQHRRSYHNWSRTWGHDWELPKDTMPKDIKKLMRKDPTQMNFFENYWYWQLRGQASLVNPERLPTLSYRQLARDMGFAKIHEPAEHMVGLIELYEYLCQSPFIGPFGTVENPCLVPSVHNMRGVGCTGGTGDNEHHALWFFCREGFLYRCGECDQIFMLVRVQYDLPDGSEPFPVDEDIDDIFDYSLIEKGQKMWNAGDYVHWGEGDVAYRDVYLYGGGPPDETELLEENITPEHLAELKKEQLRGYWSEHLKAGETSIPAPDPKYDKQQIESSEGGSK